MRKTLIITTAILGLLASVAVWSFMIEPDLLVVREVTVDSDHWLARYPPLRIAVVSDLHVGAPHIDLAKVEEVVDTVNGLKPDLVVLLGDYVEVAVLFGRFVEPRPIMQRLSRLRARLGVVGVLGNHDWWYDGKKVWSEAEAAGIPILENDVRAFQTDGGPFWIAGLADDMTRSPNPVGTVRKVPPGEPVIVLSHDPAVFRDVPRDVSVVLAGHTHAGQVRLPFFGAFVIPGRAPLRHSYGLIRESGKVMYVSAGIGTSIIPVRLNAPPEIALITLRSRSQTN
jgi:predicted MPP superfamily phosphohydrolase